MDFVLHTLILFFLVYIAAMDYCSLRVALNMQTVFLLLCSLLCLEFSTEKAFLHGIAASIITGILLLFHKYTSTPGYADITVLFSLAVGYGGFVTIFIITVTTILTIFFMIFQYFMSRNNSFHFYAIPVIPFLAIAFYIFLEFRYLIL